MQESNQWLEYARASSKGQVVIPTKIRRKLKIADGSILAVAAQDDMIVMKKVDSKITAEDLKTLHLIDEAWKDIEMGRYKERSKESFFTELKQW